MRQPWAADLVLSPKEPLLPDTSSPFWPTQAAHRGAAPEEAQCPKSQGGSPEDGWHPFPISGRCWYNSSIPSLGWQFLFPCRHLVAKVCIPVFPVFSREKATCGPFQRPRVLQGLCTETRALHRCVRMNEHCVSLSAVTESYLHWIGVNQWQKISGRRPEAFCSNCTILIFERSMLLSMWNT